MSHQYASLKRRFDDRHRVFQDILYLLYSTTDIAGATVHSWKCAKYRYGMCPRIAKYHHDDNITLELFTPDINDFDGTSDDEDSIVPLVTLRNVVKPFPCLHPLTFALLSHDTIPFPYADENKHRGSTASWEKIYDIINVPQNLSTKHALFTHLTSSLTTAMSDLSTIYDQYGVSATFQTDWRTFGTRNVYGDPSPWMQGALVNRGPTARYPTDATQLYAQLINLHDQLTGNDDTIVYIPADIYTPLDMPKIPLELAPLTTTLILDIPQTICASNTADFLEATILAFGRKNRHWARNTIWRVLGNPPPHAPHVDEEAYDEGPMIFMTISAQGEITSTQDLDMGYMRYHSDSQP